MINYYFVGLWALVNADTWVALGECEWIPPSVLKRSVDINFNGVARLTQVNFNIICTCSIKQDNFIN